MNARNTLITNTILIIILLVVIFFIAMKIGEHNISKTIDDKYMNKTDCVVDQKMADNFLINCRTINIEDSPYTLCEQKKEVT